MITDPLTYILLLMGTDIVLLVVIIVTIARLDNVERTVIKRTNILAQSQRSWVRPPDPFADHPDNTHTGDMRK